MKTEIKINGTKIEPETEAGAVLYGGSSLEAALSNAGSSRISPFGRQLLQADEAEFKRLLQISTDTFVDEGGNLWNNYAAELSTVQVKFGTQSLLTTSGNIQSAHPLTFGGDPFTVSFWARPTSLEATHYLFRALGTSRSFGFGSNSTPLGEKFMTGTTSVTTTYKIVGAAASTEIYCTQATGAWQHYEIDYNGSGNVKAFFNGTLKWNISLTIAREPRRIIFGRLAGCIDECRILDGVCEHTAAFTRPSDKYSFDDYPDNTLVLLHFE